MVQFKFNPNNPNYNVPTSTFNHHQINIDEPLQNDRFVTFGNTSVSVDIEVLEQLLADEGFEALIEELKRLEDEGAISNLQINEKDGTVSFSVDSEQKSYVIRNKVPTQPEVEQGVPKGGVLGGGDTPDEPPVENDPPQTPQIVTNIIEKIVVMGTQWTSVGQSFNDTMNSEEKMGKAWKEFSKDFSDEEKVVFKSIFEKAWKDQEEELKDGGNKATFLKQVHNRFIALLKDVTQEYIDEILKSIEKPSDTAEPEPPKESDSDTTTETGSTSNDVGAASNDDSQTVQTERKDGEYRTDYGDGYLIETVNSGRTVSCDYYNTDGILSAHRDFHENGTYTETKYRSNGTTETVSDYDTKNRITKTVYYKADGNTISYSKEYEYEDGYYSETVKNSEDKVLSKKYYDNYGNVITPTFKTYDELESYVKSSDCQKAVKASIKTSTGADYDLFKYFNYAAQITYKYKDNFKFVKKETLVEEIAAYIIEHSDLNTNTEPTNTGGSGSDNGGASGGVGTGSGSGASPSASSGAQENGNVDGDKSPTPPATPPNPIVVAVKNKIKNIPADIKTLFNNKDVTSDEKMQKALVAFSNGLNPQEQAVFEKFFKEAWKAYETELKDVASDLLYNSTFLNKVLEKLAELLDKATTDDINDIIKDVEEPKPTPDENKGPDTTVNTYYNLLYGSKETILAKLGLSNIEEIQTNCGLSFDELILEVAEQCVGAEYSNDELFEKVKEVYDGKVAAYTPDKLKEGIISTLQDNSKKGSYYSELCSKQKTIESMQANVWEKYKTLFSNEEQVFLRDIFNSAYESVMNEKGKNTILNGDFLNALNDKIIALLNGTETDDLDTDEPDPSDNNGDSADGVDDNGGGDEEVPPASNWSNPVAEEIFNKSESIKNNLRPLTGDLNNPNNGYSQARCKQIVLDKLQTILTTEQYELCKQYFDEAWEEAADYHGTAGYYTNDFFDAIVNYIITKLTEEYYTQA